VTALEGLPSNFEVVRSLGRGGMGELFVVRDTSLDRDVAVKVVLPEARADAAYMQRFQREARAVAKLNNPHIVSAYQWGTLADGAPYLVMELLEGEDLGALLRKGRIPYTDAVRYVRQACAGLAAAHAAGIVHRDLKPPNLFITTAQILKVLDFGIAKQLAATPEPDAQLTQLGHVPGSPLYMAPEQIQGQPVDARTDLWALGVILFELLTGNPPFSGETLFELQQRITSAPVPSLRGSVPELPEGLEAVVLRCLERGRDRRIASAVELSTALEPFERSLEEYAETAHQAPGPPRQKTTHREARNVPQAAAAAAAGVSPGAVLASKFHRGEALLDDLKTRDYVFAVGSGLSPDVPSADGMVAEMRERHRKRGQDDFKRFNDAVRAADPYAAAVRHFLKYSDESSVHRFVRRQTLEAFRAPGRASNPILNDDPNDEERRTLERDADKWRLSPGTRALGRMLASDSRRSDLCLTFNFDPLLEVAITLAGGEAHSIALLPDGSIPAGKRKLVHLHGHWARSEALHATVINETRREDLESSIKELVDGRSVVVIGYAGADVKAVTALARAVRDGRRDATLMWAFVEETADEVREKYGKLLDLLAEAKLPPSSLALFYGVDAERFLPRLAERYGFTDTAEDAKSMPVPGVRPSSKSFPASAPRPSVVVPDGAGTSTPNVSVPPVPGAEEGRGAKGRMLLFLGAALACILIGTFATIGNRELGGRAFIGLALCLVAFGVLGSTADVDGTIKGVTVKLAGPVVLLLVVLYYDSITGWIVGKGANGGRAISSADAGAPHGTGSASAAPLLPAGVGSGESGLPLSAASAAGMSGVAHDTVAAATVGSAGRGGGDSARGGRAGVAVPVSPATVDVNVVLSYDQNGPCKAEGMQVALKGDKCGVVSTVKADCTLRYTRVPAGCGQLRLQLIGGRSKASVCGITAVEPSRVATKLTAALVAPNCVGSNFTPTTRQPLCSEECS
jgi:serine/threonine protein kinase